MKKIMTVVIVAAGLGGCAFGQPVTERAAKGVHKYCTTLTRAERQLTRNSINAALAVYGHRVQVTCAGDE